MQLQKHVILRSRYLSDAVVFAVMGVRSVEAEWHLSVVTLALQLAALPDDHIRRRALAALWVEWREVVDREEASRLRIVLRDIWWARLHAVLSLMDYTEWWRDPRTSQRVCSGSETWHLSWTLRTMVTSGGGG
jgi:hypothetical protein